MSGWHPMETAPRDGTQILLARCNGCAWEYVVAFWSENDDGTYPWQGDCNAYPEDRMDCWQAITEPWDVPE